jgi:polyisoprenoid-binding protein YceI
VTIPAASIDTGDPDRDQHGNVIYVDVREDEVFVAHKNPARTTDAAV